MKTPRTGFSRTPRALEIGIRAFDPKTHCDLHRNFRVARQSEDRVTLPHNATPTRSVSLPILLSLFTLLMLSAISAAALDLVGRAQLEALPGSVREVVATESLPVKALGAQVAAPVEAQRILVELDLAKLQRRLDGTQRELREVRELRRTRRSSGEVRPPGGLNSAGFEGPPNQFEANLAQREADALSEFADLSSRLASAHVRAPDDGFVVGYQVAPGKNSKRRKPALTFVELAKTRLTVTIDPAPAEEFAMASEVLVISASDPTQRFRARLDSLVTTSEKTAGYAFVPLELPFIALGDGAEVRLASPDSAPAAGD